MLYFRRSDDTNLEAEYERTDIFETGFEISEELERYVSEIEKLKTKVHVEPPNLDLKQNLQYLFEVGVLDGEIRRLCLFFDSVKASKKVGLLRGPLEEMKKYLIAFVENYKSKESE